MLSLFKLLAAVPLLVYASGSPVADIKARQIGLFDVCLTAPLPPPLTTLPPPLSLIFELVNCSATQTCVPVFHPDSVTVTNPNPPPPSLTVTVPSLGTCSPS